MMGIPVPLFGVVVGGLLAAYVAIIYRLFQFARDLETDLNVMVGNLKTRELARTKGFIEVELSNAMSTTEPVQPAGEQDVRDEEVRKFMQETWKNLYSCCQAETLVDKLHERETTGQKWCIVGIICAVVAFIWYLVPWTNLAILKTYSVFGLCFFPLLIVAIYFFANVSIRHSIRDCKKEVEKLWHF